MLVEVGLGKVETVMKRDPQRQKPSAGHDSILVSTLTELTDLFVD